VGIIGVKQLGLFSFCMVAIAVLTTSFLVARSVESLSRMIRQIQKQKIVWFGLVAMFLLVAGFTLICSRESTSLIMLTRTFGQIVLYLLLVVRPPVLGLRVKVWTTLP
jgi:hypothetical protein